MKKAAIFFVLFFSFVFIPQLRAQEAVDTLWQDANSPVYGTKVGGMLGRGLLNIATCFVDLVVHVVEGSKQGPPVVGPLTGLGSGIACTALRVTSGALDIVTFWVPSFNGFPVSRSYSNCLEFEAGELGTASETGTAAPAVAPAYAPQDYAKPAARAKKHNALDYAKK